MLTREQALSEVSALVVEQGRILDTLTPAQAAERAWRPGGPSREDLASRFAAERCRVLAA